jgi:hypothetical protein
MAARREDGKLAGSQSFEEPPWDIASEGSMRALVSVELVYVSPPLCFRNSNISLY